MMFCTSNKQNVFWIIRCCSITCVSSPLFCVNIKKFFCTYTYCNHYSCSPLLPSDIQSNIQNTLAMKDISNHFTTFLKQFLLSSLVLMTDNIPNINFLLFIPCIKLVIYNTQPTKCTKFDLYTFVIILKQ
jgi:hypothetical protein